MGKNRQAAKNEVERLDLANMTCREGVKVWHGRRAPARSPFFLSSLRCMDPYLISSTYALPLALPTPRP